MSDKKKKKESEQEKENKEWNKRAKEIWLAGLGALAAVEEGGSKLFRGLVDRGSEFEKSRKKEIDEMWDEVSGQFKKVETQVGEKFDKAEKTIEKNIKSVISELGIPTRKEVEELAKKVDALNEKLNKISQKPSEGGSGKRKQGASSSGKSKSGGKSGS